MEMNISDTGDAESLHSEPLDAEVADSANLDYQDEEEEFIYPVTAAPANAPSKSSPAQLEALFAIVSSGDLSMLMTFFKNALDSGVQPFSLSNDTIPRTGSTALHTAAGRGYIDIVAWLIEHCGAMLDLEDREGETALHRASLHGHLNIVRYLIGHEAEVHAIDADGWTALHNACSKGYLDIVRCLCENGNLEKTVDGVRGIDARNKDGWTPLMNASSKGHLPIVLYLVRQGADPLIRNKWGETAYDTAAAVFQVWICEVLQQVEAEHWRNSPIPYNPLAVHTSVPVIIYENQKLDTRLKTLAVSGPKFSASGLDRRERRPPFEIKFPRQPYSGAAAVTAWSDVQLPCRDAPWIFPEPSKPEKQTAATGDHSHFWLSEWIVDVTHPKVDVKDGWQYAHHFTDADEQWTAEKPLSLQRVLKDGGVVASSVRTVQNWVRRRRWVRIMRRRIDIPPLPFLQADGDMYHLASDGTLIPYVDEKSQDDGGKELGPIAPTFLPSAQDYVARARYLVGNQTSDGDADYPSSTAAELRLSVFKLEDATAELRRGILDDEDGDRKTQAEVLFNAYNRGLERLRLAASARGWLILSEDDSEGDDDGSDFHYPIPPMEDYQSISTSDTLTAGVHTDDSRSVSRASTITAYAVSPTDFTPQLSKAPDFRVPTHEAPQVGLSSKGPLLQQSVLWERDEKVSNCRDCNCRFGLLTRRHHCRKCGRIFCDNCSAFRALLDPPQVPGRLNSPKSSNLQRVCRACYADVTESLSFQDKKATMEPIIININQLNGSSASRGQACRFGNLLLCPVCKFGLEQLGDTEMQENHIKECLEGAAKYLVYDLPAEKGLIGAECVLCPEPIVKGSRVARLSCLCSFHNTCLTAWLQRGKGCPEHAR